MIQFFESVMGHRFFEGHVPEILKQLRQLNENLAALNASFPLITRRPESTSSREDALEACVKELIKHIFTEELAGHLPNELLHMACELTGINIDELAYIDLWADDRIQFARLLEEINATQEVDISVLQESMDLPLESVKELFERARHVWEKSKENNCP